MTFASPSLSSVGATPRSAPNLSTCQAASYSQGPNIAAWRPTSSKSPGAPITASSKQQSRIGTPSLQAIRSQRNRVLLERVANQTDARPPVSSSPQRQTFASAARTPVATNRPQLASSARFSSSLAKENTSQRQRAAPARHSTVTRREIRAQPQAVPAATVTNSRLRQAALYARRHQFRQLTAAAPGASHQQPAPANPLRPLAKCRPGSPFERNHRKLAELVAGKKSAELVKKVVGSLEQRKSSCGIELATLELLPASRKVPSGASCAGGSWPTIPAAKVRPSGDAGSADAPAAVASSETRKPKTNIFPQTDQNNIRKGKTFVINRYQKLASDRSNREAQEEAVVAAGPPKGAAPTSEQDNKIENSNQIPAGEKMRLEQENSQSMSLILEANGIQRSRSSLGSSRNSLESSSDDQMILGSPLVSPPPSEPDELLAADNRLHGSTPPPVEPKLPLESTNKSAESPNQQNKKLKKGLIDIPIRQDSISDFYELESRPFARGKFAQVKRCVSKTTRQCFAAKCIKKRRRLVDIRHEILLEIEALKLSYYTDRIIKLYEVFETTNEIILILEMANGGELQRVLDEEESISEGIVKKMARQILDGLIELHENDIAHLDIKPQNLLLSEPFPDGDIKLCDFGISRRITKECEIREICGTPDYVAPEILRYDPISLATDMWSLGVLIYVLLSGYSPFGSDNKQQTFCNITQATLDFPAELFDKNEISRDAIDFMGKLIVRNPTERLTSKQARNHSWLSNE